MKPTRSKGRSPWKVKKATGGTRAGGIVIPKDAILVNQGLKKVKLEEDYVDRKPDLPISMEIEESSTSSREPGNGPVMSGEKEVIKKYVVTKGKADAPRSEEDGHDRGSSSSGYAKEFEALKCTVKQLTLQMEKQNEVNKKQDEAIKMQIEAIKKQKETVKEQNHEIAGMKSFMRVIGLAITNYFNDSEERNVGCHGENEESPGNYGSDHGQQRVIQDNLSGDNQRNSVIDSVQGNDHVSASAKVWNGDINERESDQQDYSGQKDIHEDNEQQIARKRKLDNADGDLEEDAGVSDNEDGDDDSSYVPNDSECESDKEDVEDENDRPGNNIRSVKTRVKDNQEGNSEESFECSECGKNFDSKDSLYVHTVRYHVGKKHKCHLCPKAFSFQYNLQKHIRSVHDCVRYKCSHCSAAFTQSHSLYKHDESVHKTGKPIVECKICGLHAANLPSLKNHLAKKHKPKPDHSKTNPTLECKLCGVRFKNVDSLKIHVSKTHQTNLSKTGRNGGVEKKRRRRRCTAAQCIIFQCERCPLHFTKREDLRFHLSQVHGFATPQEEVKI